MTRLQQLTLVLLRTVIGWHFLYEGYVKLLWPAWTRDGSPLAPFSSAGYLQGASGPLADVLHRLADPRVAPWVDIAVTAALLLAGALLILGVFTQLGGAMALTLLVIFYLSAVPLDGSPQPGAEGTYLIVNKNLIEAVAVAVVLAFRTGGIAGLDLLRRRRGRRTAAPVEQAPA